MGFSRQEYRSGLPFPSPGDLLNPEIEPGSPAFQADALTSEPPQQRHSFAKKRLSSQGYSFSSSHVWMWELDCKESWVPKNWCFGTVVLEKTLESLLDSKEIKAVNQRKSTLNIHWKDWCWNWNCTTLAICCKELTPWKKSWCWERLRAGGEVDNRGWDDWMASLTQWIWWRTGKLDVLQSMGSQRVGHNLATEQQWPQQSTLLHFMLNHIQWNFFMAIFHILSPSSYTVRWISRAFCLLRIYKCVKIQNDK